MSITYREAHYGDWEAIADLHARSWQRHYRESFPDTYLDHLVVEDRRTIWEKRLKEAADHQYVVLALEGAVLKGFACLYFDEDPQWGALLDNIHVDPQAMGHGLGKQLMQMVVRELVRKAPDSGMYLWVLEKNQGAQQFYRRLGGCDEGRSPVDTPGAGTAIAHRYSWQQPAMLLDV